MRYLLVCSLAAGLSLVPSSALAHDGGSIKHKNKYLRSKVIKLSGDKTAPGCDLVARKCRDNRNPSYDDIRRYFNIMRRMIQPPTQSDTIYAEPSILSSEPVANTYSAPVPVPTSNTGCGPGYRGLFQFDCSTWQSVGGTGDPAAASPEEQWKRAQILQSRRGNQPWPVCGQGGASLGEIAQCESGGDPNAVG